MNHDWNFEPDDDDMVPASALIEWARTHGGLQTCPFGEMPEPGTVTSYGDFRPLHYGYETPTYLEIRDASFSDYSGSGYHRSNHRSLLRDFGDYVIDTYGGHGTEALFLRLDSLIPILLAEAVVSMGEYPVYDEDDWSELETETEQEDWDGWGRWEMRQLVEDTYRELTRQELYDDEVVTDERLNALFWEQVAEGNVGYELESAVSGTWWRFAEAGEAIGRRLAQETYADWENQAASYVRGPLDQLLPLQIAV
ncbi:hypothetical protein OG474_30115 [Kribbella sp. NBC_01505]|uniref:hypothetical protein n=1 Tax=Kribbella sp. NBC_01505 TaxID=2903580 RepID=UPI00386F6C72